MQEGDKIKALKGKHQDKVGEAIWEWRGEALFGEFEGKDLRGTWAVQFDDGSRDYLHESEMSVVAPE
jgi:hypothetical protein|tara:strand:- start:202 stop:402 length:201 start_codon:yes stop_codon:yes gene_type:complete